MSKPIVTVKEEQHDQLPGTYNLQQFEEVNQEDNNGETRRITQVENEIHDTLNWSDLSEGESTLSLSPEEQTTINIYIKLLRENILNETNALRAHHQAQPLKLSIKLCRYANRWAKHLAVCDILEHRPNPKYGENIVRVDGKLPNGIEIVRMWYRESELYDFEDGGFSLYTGHFTQLVWANSLQLGIGVALKPNFTWIVCNYSPPGNIEKCYFKYVQTPLPFPRPTIYVEMIEPHTKFFIKDSLKEKPPKRKFKKSKNQ